MPTLPVAESILGVKMLESVTKIVRDLVLSQVESLSEVGSTSGPNTVLTNEEQDWNQLAFHSDTQRLQ